VGTGVGAGTGRGSAGRRGGAGISFLSSAAGGRYTVRGGGVGAAAGDADGVKGTGRVAVRIRSVIMITCTKADTRMLGRLEVPCAGPSDSLMLTINNTTVIPEKSPDPKI
jgi:hypothetical protein